jgi:hypothetical protein
VAEVIPTKPPASTEYAEFVPPTASNNNNVNEPQTQIKKQNLNKLLDEIDEETKGMEPILEDNIGKKLYYWRSY